MVFGRDSIWTFSRLRTSGAIEEYRAHRWHRVGLSWKPETATALSSQNIWALAQSKAGEALLMHWNGRSRHRTQITIHGSAQNMTADNSYDVWVESEDRVSQGWYYNWRPGAVTSIPGAAGIDYQPRALANQPGTHFEWAVGYERPPRARGTKAMIWIYS